jgi:hypothetical protein
VNIIVPQPTQHAAKNARRDRLISVRTESADATEVNNPVTDFLWSFMLHPVRVFVKEYKLAAITHCQTPFGSLRTDKSVLFSPQDQCRGTNSSV